MTGMFRIIKEKPYNGQLTTSLQWNTSSSESSVGSGYERDILSNGFKIRNTGTETNASGGTYLYIAFAQNPFQANGGLAQETTYLVMPYKLGSRRLPMDVAWTHTDGRSFLPIF